jgi:hypothetical protein
VKRLTAAELGHYQKEGYLSPLAGLTAEDAAAARRRLLGLIGVGGLPPDLRLNPHLYLCWVADLVSRAEILDAVEDVLGPDVLVWRTTFFVKQGHDPGYVGWHQDSAYWGLSPLDVVTAWLALTDSTPENGCVRVMPGSHLLPERPHVLGTDQRNQLLRGQEIEGGVASELARDVGLAAGQFSLHHVGIIHGSGANRSDGLRAGLAIRYLAPHVRPAAGRSVAVSLRGRDTYGYFDLATLPPRPDDPEALRWHARSTNAYAGEVLREILRRPFAGLTLLVRLLLRPGTLRVVRRWLFARRNRRA